MKIWFIYIALFLSGVIIFFAIINLTSSPENHIIGEWKELKWEYEKVDKKHEDASKLKHISEEEENLIGQNLIIHKAETWTFFSDGILKLSGAGHEKFIDWRIKGRGNILQLKYHNNNATEVYNITELDDERMVLNFETDIQARGITKLTFKKIK